MAAKSAGGLVPHLKAFINSPTGPKTTHFWGPVANWGFVIAVGAPCPCVVLPDVPQGGSSSPWLDFKTRGAPAGPGRLAEAARNDLLEHDER